MSHIWVNMGQMWVGFFFEICFLVKCSKGINKNRITNYCWYVQHKFGVHFLVIILFCFFHFYNKMFLNFCLTLIMFLFLFFLFHNLDLGSCGPCFYFGFKNLVNLGVFMLMTPIRCDLTIQWIMVTCSLIMFLGVWTINCAFWRISIAKLIKVRKSSWFVVFFTIFAN